MARFILQHMAVSLRRHGKVASRQRFVAHRQHLDGVLRPAMPMTMIVVMPVIVSMVMATTAATSGQVGDKSLDLAFRDRAHETIHRLAVAEGIDGRDGLDAQLLGDLGILVDVHLDHLHRAAGGDHRGFQLRAERLAGAAPGRPEIHDHRHFAAGDQHVGGKGGQARILDVGTVAARRVLHGLRGNGAPAGADQCHVMSISGVSVRKMVIQGPKGKTSPRGAAKGRGYLSLARSAQKGEVAVADPKGCEGRWGSNEKLFSAKGREEA